MKISQAKASAALRQLEAMTKVVEDLTEERDAAKRSLEFWKGQSADNKALFAEQKNAAIKLAEERNAARRETEQLRLAMAGETARAQRAEAIAEMLHAQLYPRPKLPWQQGSISYQHVGSVDEFRED